MRRYVLSVAAILFLAGILLTACGGKEQKKAEESVWQGVAPGMEDLTALTERTEYYDIAVEAEDLFDLGLGDKMPQNQMAIGVIAQGGTAVIPVGTQFLQGEPVQLWAEAESGGADIYLYRKDGSRELLLENVSNEYISTKLRPSCRWYIDQEGDYYCYGGIWHDVSGLESEDFLAKFRPSGEMLYETHTEQGIYIRGFCQTEDGRIYLLLKDPAGNIVNGSWSLAEADPATGELLRDSVRELTWNYEMYLGKAGSFPAVMGYSEDSSRQLARMDMEDGSLLPVLYFTGISYGWHDELKLQDYRVREDGVIELLWTEANGAGGLLEQLKMEKVERLPLVVRGSFADDIWLRNRVMQFNRENDTYHVVLDDCGIENDEEEFARLTSIQIAAGKGPDMIEGGLMRDYLEGLLDKGALEDLAPYMKASGVREEAYFPLAFAFLRQGERIYSVTPKVSVWDYKLAEEVLEGMEELEIEALADALLAREGKGRYCQGYDAGEVLRVFLQGTEDLWGMVDWESGSCEFHTPLFGKLLEAARRYGDDGRKSMDSIAANRSLSSVFDLEGYASLREEEMEGKKTFGVLFDDGVHAVSEWQYSSLLVNANSAHKDGAWEFIRFLISEEVQSADFKTLYVPPVHREAFDTWEQWRMDTSTYISWKGKVKLRTFNGRPVTDQMRAEFKERIEDARPLPIRTAPLLDIILEEAGDYFTGSKSAEEVSEVVNKRVQMYLNERE